MITIKSVGIREFRGIRKLDLDLNAKNFGICGPNGTGKSGVVDAIEFVLTGNITRLTREGSGELRLSEHGPHVDMREHPENAVVTLIGTLDATGSDVTISRSIKSPAKPIVEPDTSEVHAAIEEISLHPKFALSRREIVKYIITPPGKRATDVQTLLRLDELEKIRKSIQAVANAAERDARAEKAEHSRARAEFLKSLGVLEPSAKLILTAANDRRVLLGLPALTNLTEATALTDGLKVQDGEKIRTPKLSKKSALAEIKVLLASSQGESEKIQVARDALKTDLVALRDNVSRFKAIRQAVLVEKGIELIDGDLCPLCDTVWSEVELRSYLETKLENSSTAQAFVKALSERLRLYAENVAFWQADISKVSGYALMLGDVESGALLKSVAESAANTARIFQGSVSDSKSLAKIIDKLEADFSSLSPDDTSALEKTKSAVDAVPEQSKEDDARDELVEAQVNYTRSIERANEAQEAAQKATIAAKVLELFNQSNTTALNEIYDAVASDFQEYYRKINKDDESNFTGSLTLEPAKLTLNVDFYGRGEFPPGALHSEGHQDGMGLCLYLALMKHTLGSSFRFCVLDDVMMSVDTGHRRDVCRLLKSEFPNTQFIVTTHDRVWLQYMRAEGLVAHARLFDGWSVDTGPRVWDDVDVWKEVHTVLAANDVSKASFLLRRYLEHIGYALCDGLRAQVRFRGDGRYDFGDLVPAALSRAKNKIKRARHAAESWGKFERAEEITTALDAYSGALVVTEAERWAMNPTVHYNEWANLEAHEFAPAVDAFKTVLSYLRCEGCGGFVYISIANGKEDSMKCVCGDIQYDLTTKST